MAVEKRALVVEQDPDVRAVMAGVLRRRGYAVLAVACREEGLAVLLRLRPEVLVLDDPACEQVRRLVRLRDGASPDVTLAGDDLECAESVEAWLERALAA